MTSARRGERARSGPPPDVAVRGTGLDAVPAPLLVLVAIASVQTGSALARTAFDDVGAAGMVLLRLGLSSLLLLALLRPPVRTWGSRQWRAVLLLGSAMAGMNLVFYLSIRTVPLGVAVTVEFLGPLLVALVQTRRPRDFAWAVLAAAGVALLGLRGGGSVPLGGLLLAFVAGLFWGGYILMSARVGSLLPGTAGLAVALAVAGAVAVPFGVQGASHAVAEPGLLLVGLGVAVLSSIVPYSFELSALRRIPTRVFGVLMSLEPGAAAVAGLVVLKQTLGPRELVALVLVTLASVGVTLDSRTVRPPEC